MTNDIPPEIQQLEAIQRRLNEQKSPSPAEMDEMSSRHLAEAGAKIKAIRREGHRDNKPRGAANLPKPTMERWGYFDIGNAAGWIVGALTFLVGYVYCIVAYGFLLGGAIGWIPSLILAGIVGVITMFLWPALIGVIAVILYFLAYVSPGGGNSRGIDYINRSHDYCFGSLFQVYSKIEK